ncbi:hypothetical protein ANCCAN_23314 [Ancylostoma caninum]|uniref:Uncharacterized protein n=1 Tax=Ancylostoma caninum TaxID=29170 RepID=A0A368FJ77_ANCCA|nr:hypothetical protein ANCCAN_23314 [Ancylostoma caninum]
MNILTICLLFALLVIYANAQILEDFAPEEEVAPIRVKRQWGMGMGWGRPWYGGGWGRPWGMGGGMWGGGGWGYPGMGGMWG